MVFLKIWNSQIYNSLHERPCKGKEIKKTNLESKLKETEINLDDANI